jgi:erythromycin esterase-like protein
MSYVRSGRFTPATGRNHLPELIARAAEPLPEIDDPAFGRHFDRFGDARVVLLGEASHGTSEFYRARAAITRWLIEHRGFNVVALEADWPDARAFDAQVRHRPPPLGAKQAFTRFPTWMWRNTEFSNFLGWLRGHNAGLAEAKRAGVYGLDLYNLSASMRAVIDYLEGKDPEAAKLARQRYGCLTPWAEEPAAYGRMAPAWCATRRPTIGPCTMAARRPGTCATPTCSRPSRRCWPPRARTRAPWSGRTIPTSGMRGRPRWARSATN